MSESLKASVEELYGMELAALRAYCHGCRPDGWSLTPAVVEDFILGRSEPLSFEGRSLTVKAKFFGNDDLVKQCINTLAQGRNLLLAGKPGTGKSWLSELLAAAISNNSRNIIQGTAALKPSALRYSWNYAQVAAHGYQPQALIPAALYRGMEQGIITRFEEISRTSQQVHDTLLSILSSRMLIVHELRNASCLQARAGFAVIATANTVDPGIFPGHALRELFEVCTVEPVREIGLKLNMMESEVINAHDHPVDLSQNRSMLDLVMSVYDEIASGRAISELAGHMAYGSAAAWAATQSSHISRPSQNMSISCPVKNLRESATIAQPERAAGMTPGAAPAAPASPAAAASAAATSADDACKCTQPDVRPAGDDE